MADQNTRFVFDPDISPENNVAAFIDHLAARDAELADLLRANISTLLDPSARDENAARREFNRVIVEKLDAPQVEPKEEKE